MAAEGIEPWGEVMTAVRFEIGLHQPDTAQLAGLAVLVLEEIWQSYRDQEAAALEVSGGGVGPWVLRACLKRLLEMAHEMRVMTRT